MKDCPVKGEEITYLSKKEMIRRIMTWGWPKWRASLIGGYCTPSNKKIYIRMDRKDDVKLLNHERGHLRGYNHTWYPTLMASSWAYRWLNRYHPPHGRKGE